MKKLNYAIMLAISVLALSTATAQEDSSGIYKTADDFRQRKLSYAINYKKEKHKIKNNLLFDNAELKVKHADETYTLLKSETYGYRSTKGEEFRFVDNKEYMIIIKVMAMNVARCRMMILKIMIRRHYQLPTTMPRMAIQTMRTTKYGQTKIRFRTLTIKHKIVTYKLYRFLR